MKRKTKGTERKGEKQDKTRQDKGKAPLGYSRNFRGASHPPLGARLAAASCTSACSRRRRRIPYAARPRRRQWHLQTPRPRLSPQLPLVPREPAQDARLWRRSHKSGPRGNKWRSATCRRSEQSGERPPHSSRPAGRRRHGGSHSRPLSNARGKERSDGRGRTVFLLLSRLLAIRLVLSLLSRPTYEDREGNSHLLLPPPPPPF